MSIPDSHIRVAQGEIEVIKGDTNSETSFKLLTASCQLIMGRDECIDVAHYQRPCVAVFASRTTLRSRCGQWLVPRRFKLLPTDTDDSEFRHIRRIVTIQHEAYVDDHPRRQLLTAWHKLSLPRCAYPQIKRKECKGWEILRSQRR